MKALLQLLLVVLVIGLGVGIFKILSSMRKPPAREEKPIAAPLVEAFTAHPEDLRMIVYGFGTAQPKVSVQVVPQVSGRVVASHADFVAGGFFKAGEPLVRIEPDDYELAVENASALVAQAEYMLRQEEAEALVARTEWEQLHGDKKPPSPLVLRLPQIKNAKAQLQAAQSLLSRAKLDLERTAISMPFDGRVVTKNVDQGQYVTPGQPIATVYGTDVIEIIVPLEDKELEWFDAPLGYTNGNMENDRAGAAAVVTAEFAGSTHSWKGRIVRTQGRIDAASRMVAPHVRATVKVASTVSPAPVTSATSSCVSAGMCTGGPSCSKSHIPSFPLVIRTVSAFNLSIRAFPAAMMASSVSREISRVLSTSATLGFITVTSS